MNWARRLLSFLAGNCAALFAAVGLAALIVWSINGDPIRWHFRDPPVYVSAGWFAVVTILPPFGLCGIFWAVFRYLNRPQTKLAFGAPLQESAWARGLFAVWLWVLGVLVFLGTFVVLGLATANIQM